MIRIAPPQTRPVAPAPTTPAPTAAQLKRAEAQLKATGFNPGKVDGKASPAFRQALSEFQKAWGLPVTGALDAKTSERLAHTARRVIAHRKDLFVSIGQKSARIQGLERQLTRLGYDVGKADGIYGRDTAAAVRAFRKDQKELTDGYQFMGAKAQKVLAREVKALQHDPERRRLAPTKAQGRLDRATTAAVTAQPLAEGAHGAAVANVQKHLRAAGFDPKHGNGVFDERTAAAVKAFQQRAHLPVTGSVDKQTWGALQRSFILSKKPASPAQGLGERSGAVKASEALLKKVGLNPGKVDGLFDRHTLKAVKAFEKKHHLQQDGKIDAKELALMKKASKSDYRARVLETARRYLGFHEQGDNGNPFSRYFGRPSEAWCADFVSFCYSKAGKRLNECYTPTLLAKLHANGTYTRNNPKAGDIIMFDWHPGSGVSAEHTGLVEKVFRRSGRLYVQTIEGNSSNMVRRNVYAVGDSRIAGFGTVR